MKLGQAVRNLLPEGIRPKVPAKSEHGALAGTGAPAQGAAAGRLRATGDAAQHQLRHRPVLDAVGIQTVVIDQAVCCGAVKFHLNDQEGGKDQMRANIDAWWPAVQAGEVEAIVSNASGCGVMIKRLRPRPAPGCAVRRQNRPHQRPGA